MLLQTLKEHSKEAFHEFWGHGTKLVFQRILRTTVLVAFNQLNLTDLETLGSFTQLTFIPFYPSSLLGLTLFFRVSACPEYFTAGQPFQQPDPGLFGICKALTGYMKNHFQFEKNKLGFVLTVSCSISNCLFPSVCSSMQRINYKEQSLSTFWVT